MGDVVLRRGHEIRGLVLDRRSGERIAGAAVRIEQTATLLSEWVVQEDTELRTDARGRFRMRGLWAEQVELYAAARDHVNTEQELRFTGEGDLRVVRFELERGGDTISGVVTDGRERPVPGARVCGKGVNGLRQSAFTRADALGEFALSGLQDGLLRMGRGV